MLKAVVVIWWTTSWRV